MRVFRYVFCSLLIVCFVSCASRRQTTILTYNPKKDVGRYESSSKKSTKKNSTKQSEKSSISLSSAEKKLGLRITKNDNQKLYLEAASWLGVPYKYGGTSRSGVDCSGFTHLMYKTVYGKTLSRQSSAILQNDCKKINKKDLREGDLVFFRTDGKKSSIPNHVGIYLKEQKFIHASSSKGVVISALDNSYYERNWLAAGRVSR